MPTEDRGDLWDIVYAGAEIYHCVAKVRIVDVSKIVQPNKTACITCRSS